MRFSLFRSYRAVQQQRATSVFRPLCLFAALAVGGAAHAQSSIGISFSSLITASDSPGIVAATNYNVFATASGTNLALLNSSGQATTARLTFNSTGHSTAIPGTNTANAATNRLYQQSIYGDANTREITITVTNIPFATYDIYVYADSDNTATNTVSLSDGIRTFYMSSGGSVDTAATVLTQTTSTNSRIPTVGPGQYQVFDGKSGASFTLTSGGSINNVLAQNVRGLQIVQTTAPEPGTLPLLGMGLATGLGIVGTVRRRKAK